MERHFLETLHVLMLLALASIAIYAILFKSRNRRLPPSPPSLPIIGHLHLLGKLPHQSLLKLAEKYGGLMFLRLGTVNTLVASSPDAAKEVLRTHDHVFASRPASSTAEYFGYKGANLVFAPYGEHWKHLRKLCTMELLSAKRVEMFQPVRKSEMSLLLGELFNSSKERSIVDLTTKLSDLTFNIIMRMVMNKSYSGPAGGNSSEKEQALFFKNTISAGLILASGLNIGEFIPYLKWMDRQASQIKLFHRHLDDFLQKQVDEHRQTWKEGQAAKDFIDVMLDTGGLDNNRIKGMALDMIAGGTDTSAVTVEWGLAELVRSPEVLKKAKAELIEVVGPDRTLEESDIPKLKYLQAVVKEIFRLHPAGPLTIPHESTEVCKVSDYVVPAKMRVLVNLYAIGRDPSVWKEPLKFKPDRFLGGNGSAIDVRGHNFELLPFGSGRRMCPGVLLGITTVQFVLGSLLHAFDWHMPEGHLAEELDMAERFGLTVARASPLKLVPFACISTEAYQKMEVEI